ncbi:DNA-directed RNA polymerase subunit alpha [Chloroflexus sp.]|uniref:DNA-directed RNA polymerase subunit alpha n=1 Tax=Chloroflexus sp. TaxID=1904827 RepID=UPI00261364B7|nr:DNA-directed RNA polymerase subunit alpha [uncultured Chloroflexus sp.]
MLDIAQPKIEVVETTETFGRFKIEPLDPGYGHTLGNALRRVLLTAIPGSAITHARIAGVYRETDTIPGVTEDVVEIILNLKGIHLRGRHEGTAIATIRKQGPGIVTAADLVLPEGLAVVEPDHYICTLEHAQAQFELTATIERGRGYLSADQRGILPLGEIPIDAIFTPVPRVNYVVENTRIGQATDFDRLIIEVWTNGTVRPVDALDYAARVLVHYNTTIANFNRMVAEPEAQPEANGLEIPASIYDTSIETLELSTRTYNCLKRAEITKIGQVLQMDEKALLSVRNLGQKSMEEIRDKLIERGYIPRLPANGASR